MTATRTSSTQDSSQARRACSPAQPQSATAHEGRLKSGERAALDASWEVTVPGASRTSWADLSEDTPAAQEEDKLRATADFARLKPSTDGIIRVPRLEPPLEVPEPEDSMEKEGLARGCAGQGRAPLFIYDSVTAFHGGAQK